MPLSGRRLLLGALFVFVAVYAVFALAHMFPPAPYGLADDWRVFYAAAQVAQHGGNPYDATTIHAAEQAAQHYPVVQQSLDDFADLPVVALFLRLFAWLPYWWSFALFTACGLVATAAALVAWMRESGWRPAPAWLIGALCSWVVLLGFFSGQFDALMLGGLVAALLLMRRGSPGWAGLCMAVVLLKPHLLWPVPLLMATSWAARPRQALRFCLVTAAVLAGGALAGFALIPGSSSFFAHALQFNGRLASVQPDLAGIPGLVERLPGGQALGYAVAGVGAIAVLALAVLSARDPRLRSLPAGARGLVPLAGLAVWLACTPYAHPNDDVLLLPLLIVLAGDRGAALDRRGLEAGLLASLLVAAGFVAGLAPGAVALAIAAALLVWQARPAPAPITAAAALAALALLPAVWPFHLVAVSLTPIAATLVAVAGLMRLGAGAAASVGERQRHGRAARVVVEPGA